MPYRTIEIHILSECNLGEPNIIVQASIKRAEEEGL